MSAVARIIDVAPLIMLHLALLHFHGHFSVKFIFNRFGRILREISDAMEHKIKFQMNSKVTIL